MFTPRADGSGYDFSGQTRFDGLFTGVAFSWQNLPVPEYAKHDPNVGLARPVLFEGPLAA